MALRCSDILLKVNKLLRGMIILIDGRKANTKPRLNLIFLFYIKEGDISRSVDRDMDY